MEKQWKKHQTLFFWAPKSLQMVIEATKLKDAYSLEWRRQWHPTPVLLPGISHGWRSLVGCSPWGREELDTTERLHFHFSLSCIGEGNGNPLQCSCLENPRDGGAPKSLWMVTAAMKLKETCSLNMLRLLTAPHPGQDTQF